MINRLKGTLLESKPEKDFLRAVVDVGGVGYEVLMPAASHPRMRDGMEAVFFVSESVTSYDGATTLYGFLTKEERDTFIQIKENVGGVGPKKALECMDKISKSMPDFKRAILDGDGRLLVSVFGFTKKTAEKLIFSLKGKIESWAISGTAKWSGLDTSPKEEEALSGLINLGYAEIDARELVRRAPRNRLGEKAQTEAILADALRGSSARLG